jgi:hypothetical protein
MSSVYPELGPLGRELAIWEIHLKSTDKSPHTIKSYRQAVRALGAWLADHGLPLDPEEITTDHLRSFQAYLLAPPQHRSRVMQRFHAARESHASRDAPRSSTRYAAAAYGWRHGARPPRHSRSRSTPCNACSRCDCAKTGQLASHTLRSCAEVAPATVAICATLRANRRRNHTQPITAHNAARRWRRRRIAGAHLPAR